MDATLWQHLAASLTRIVIALLANFLGQLVQLVEQTKLL